MTAFEKVHETKVVGKLAHFDRMIFKGHLTGLYPCERFRSFLCSQGVLLKDFAGFAGQATEALMQHAKDLASQAGRPFQYLASSHTHTSDVSKERLAKKIAEKDEVREGLVCVFSVLEPCTTFTVRGNRATQKLQVVTRATKCRHLYFYFIDREFGWMHVRVQSWFPFGMQIYINGREWLARRLDEEGILYRKYDNAFLSIDDLEHASTLCAGFLRRKLHRVWTAYARRLNPHLDVITDSGFGGYYWVIDQCEFATDIMFKNRQALREVFPDILGHALRSLGAEDVMRFLGRKLHGSFQKEVSTDIKRRPEGVRIKHRMARNSIKMYDKASVLRVETTVNNPREFKVLRAVRHRSGERELRYCPMSKGLVNLKRFRDVSAHANLRYLDAMAQAELKGKAIDLLDGLCCSRVRDGKRIPKFNPLSLRDCEVFAAIMRGEHAIHGFRNRDLRERLFPSRDRSRRSQIRRSARASRLIAKLRGHGLVAKVQGSSLYRVTSRGYRIMSAVLSFKKDFFPACSSNYQFKLTA